ncbi:hypothetical protein T040910_153 [Synechococcus phage S-CAM3]|nr:hypothetical protein BOW87_gp105 [Synechococcus phage S-CAM3]AOV58897.1 hypothetical protein T040910_153 [Synechococcus phage S-CAM3]AOV59136.1 hypothetical protein C421010_153 [Synechococcus phage S-CAM3]
MTHQQIIDNVGCLVPVRQGQDASVHVELCSGAVAVLHNQVLGSQQSCQIAFDCLVRHGVSCVDAYSIYKKRGSEDPLMPLLELSLGRPSSS